VPHRLIKTPAMAFAILVSFAAWKGLNDLLGSTPVPKAEYVLGENAMVKKIHKSDAEWKASLTPERYKVMRKHGTEPAFSGLYNNYSEPGTYVCAACETPLFGSNAKYDHGTGWPSFTAPLDENNLESHEDRSFFMNRTEVRCAVCGSHLGHVFYDGPAPTFRHYCINSVALNFISAEKMKQPSIAGNSPEGDGKTGAFFSREEKLSDQEQANTQSEEATPPADEPNQPLNIINTPPENQSVAAKTENATFAAGCFWGVEHKFSQVKGVVSTETGYTGGTTKNPTYGQVCSDKTGHAEAVRVVFDPGRVSYENLVRYFFTIHDATQINRQGPDVGTQYRSVIFYHNEDQKETARRIMDELNATGRFRNPIATGLVPASEFTRAEEYHQKYYDKGKKGDCAL